MRVHRLPGDKSLCVSSSSLCTRTRAHAQRRTGQIKLLFKRVPAISEVRKGETSWKKNRWSLIAEWKEVQGWRNWQVRVLYSLKYSPLNYTVTVKLGFGVTHGHRKRHHSIDHNDFIIIFHNNYASIPFPSYSIGVKPSDVRNCSSW